VAGAALPAISLHAPYGTLIRRRVKRWETRDHPAPHRVVGQRIAIHQALQRPTRLEVIEADPRIAAALGENWPNVVSYGAFVCTAILAGSYQVDGHARSRPVLRGYGMIEDDGFGDYGNGRWCWKLTDVQLLCPIVPAKGHQFWWTWTPADA